MPGDLEKPPALSLSACGLPAGEANQIVSQSTPKSRPAVRQGDTATAVLPPAACVVLSA